MDLKDWSIHIAKEIAPNEVDLAPEMTEAFLAGGEAREQLYAESAGAGLGGFGGGEIQAVFPIVLNCLSLTVGPIITLLSSTQTGTILTVVKCALEIKTLVERDKKAKEELPEQAYRSLKSTLDAFSSGLKSAGYSQNQSDILTHRLMITLLEDPASAREFVKQFNQSSALTNKQKSKRK